MSFEAIVDNPHPTITIAHHEPIGSGELKKLLGQRSYILNLFPYLLGSWFLSQNIASLRQCSEQKCKKPNFKVKVMVGSQRSYFKIFHTQCHMFTSMRCHAKYLVSDILLQGCHSGRSMVTHIEFGSNPYILNLCPI